MWKRIILNYERKIGLECFDDLQIYKQVQKSLRDFSKLVQKEKKWKSGSQSWNKGQLIRPVLKIIWIKNSFEPSQNVFAT